jgi:hypothetical protein
MRLVLSYNTVGKNSMMRITRIVYTEVIEGTECCVAGVLYPLEPIYCHTFVFLTIRSYSQVVTTRHCGFGV